MITHRHRHTPSEQDYLQTRKIVVKLMQTSDEYPYKVCACLDRYNRCYYTHVCVPYACGVRDVVVLHHSTVLHQTTYIKDMANLPW